MSVVTATEAEQERAARAKIDRLNAIRREHAGRRGIHASAVKLDDADFARADREAARTLETPASAAGAAGSMSGRILEAAAKHADGDGVVSRDRIYGEIGAVDSTLRKKANGLIYSLRNQGRFPYTFRDAPAGRATAAGPAPRAPPAPAPRAPRGTVAIRTPAASGVAADAGLSGVAELAALIARVDAVFDEMTHEERAIASAYIGLRFRRSDDEA